MSSKREQYAKGECVDNELENLSEKLANDLRIQIRRHLGHFEIFSSQWIEMADVFGRIASISDMESKLPCGKRHPKT